MMAQDAFSTAAARSSPLSKMAAERGGSSISNSGPLLFLRRKLLGSTTTISVPPPPCRIEPGHGGPISHPNPNDVLCGRGGKINAHSGNKRFREVVAEWKPHYLDKSNKKIVKAHIAAQIVIGIRALDPPGRFLSQEGAEGGTWLDIGDEKARKKTGQALREEAAVHKGEKKKSKCTGGGKARQDMRRNNNKRVHVEVLTPTKDEHGTKGIVGSNVGEAALPPSNCLIPIGRSPPTPPAVATNDAAGLALSGYTFKQAEGQAVHPCEDDITKEMIGSRRSPEGPAAPPLPSLHHSRWQDIGNNNRSVVLPATPSPPTSVLAHSPSVQNVHVDRQGFRGSDDRQQHERNVSPLSLSKQQPCVSPEAIKVAAGCSNGATVQPVNLPLVHNTQTAVAAAAVVRTNAAIADYRYVQSSLSSCGGIDRTARTVSRDVMLQVQMLSNEPIRTDEQHHSHPLLFSGAATSHLRVKSHHMPPPQPLPNSTIADAGVNVNAEGDVSGQRWSAPLSRDRDREEQQQRRLENTAPASAAAQVAVASRPAEHGGDFGSVSGSLSLISFDEDDFPVDAFSVSLSGGRGVNSNATASASASASASAPAPAPAPSPAASKSKSTSKPKPNQPLQTTNLAFDDDDLSLEETFDFELSEGDYLHEKESGVGDVAVDFSVSNREMLSIGDVSVSVLLSGVLGGGERSSARSSPLACVSPTDIDECNRQQPQAESVLDAAPVFLRTWKKLFMTMTSSNMSFAGGNNAAANCDNLSVISDVSADFMLTTKDNAPSSRRRGAHVGDDGWRRSNYYYNHKKNGKLSTVFSASCSTTVSTSSVSTYSFDGRLVLPDFCPSIDSEGGVESICGAGCGASFGSGCLRYLADNKAAHDAFHEKRRHQSISSSCICEEKRRRHQ